MLWILLALCTAILKSLSEVAWKFFTKENSKNSHIDEMSLALWWRFFSLIILLPLFFFIPLETLSGKMCIVLILSSIFNTIGLITTLKAIKYWDLSVVWPLSSLTIPLLVITGFLIIWELPNIYGILWITCIFFWTYFLQIAKSQGWILWPIYALFEDKWAKYMIITSILWSLTASLDKLWIVEYWVLLWLLYTNIVMFFLAIIYAYFYHRYSFQEIIKIQNIKKISFITTLTWVSIVIQLFALKYTLAIYVIAIKRASWIFSVIFWALFFKEKNIIQKFIAASIMLIWVWIITILGNI